MAHEVTMAIDTKFVLNKDVEVEVKSNNKKLGTVLISKGNIEWLGANKSVNKKRLTWKQFADLMNSDGKAVRVKKAAAKKKVATKKVVAAKKPAKV